MPYCPGCGHQMCTNSLVKALDKMGLGPNDVIIVSDIGCCGLVDPLINSHSIHGLHGRSTALAMGIALGLDNPDKKVIAIQGDGGATIGLQHLLEASRQNISMTLLVQNNQVYGMTGGQISGTSTRLFKAIKFPEESEVPPYNLCDIAYSAGAAFSARVIPRGDFSDKLVEAINEPGFSFVEAHIICPSYGYKKVNELELLPFREETLKTQRLPHVIHKKDTPSLFDSIPKVETFFESNLKSRTELIIGSSAGAGAQLAADLLTFAGIMCGLNATKKGEYPITVGTGHSVAEVILSDEAINFTGIESPDVVIITSQDGLDKVKDRIDDSTRVILDSSLDLDIGREIHHVSFNKKAGKNGAVLAAIAYWIIQSGLLPLEALREAARNHKHANKLIIAIDSIAE